MKVFKKYFPDVDNWEQEEVKVICPFHTDTNPSASINTSKSLFHCWVCDVGYNEEQFISRLNNIPIKDAIKLLDNYTYKDEWTVETGRLWSNIDYIQRVKELGFSDEVINEIKLGMLKDKDTGKIFLGIPVFYNNALVDVRRYNIMKYPGVSKVMSNEGASTGWLIPYDMFLDTKETCYIFEGEKDMLMARTQGINAYTLTGGAGAKPNNYVLGAFKDKDVVLCYDNDKAGREGMYNVYLAIRDVVRSVKYINIGNLVKEEKEDFYDFIVKYDGDILDFYSEELLDFIEKEDEELKTITIKKALEDNIIKKPIRSIVTVTSEFSNAYTVPTIVEFKKIASKGKNDIMLEGEIIRWYLDDKNIVQLLELIEVDAKDKDIMDKLKQFAGIPSSEPYVKITQKDLKTIYKSTVVDKDIEGSLFSLDLYSFSKPNVGGQYKIDYKIYPHPTKHQKVVGISTNEVAINDSNNYKINKELLNKFKKDGSIADRIDMLYQSAKHHIAKHLNFNLWLMCDLVFNSILDFKYGEVMRGALDVFVLGDTQTGKSETTSKLVELYNFGHFLSLKTSTTVGLIGGSSKIDGSLCNTIGAIPRQHKRLAVLEEFSGARYDFIKTMTDIRSSNELRLSRVSGELVVPCKLRMITLSNPINDDNGSPRFLNTFPNGVMPLMELIKSAEDVARYDGFLLMPKVSKRFNPFENNLVGEPIDKKAYVHKINWVATRGVDNVKFEEGVESYIWEKAEELNELFECNFPLFATTTSKKLARFSVALASLIMNTDDSYENIIVTKDIVDYMVEFLKGIYDNNVFKLKDYADEYKSYSLCTDKDLETLQQMYGRNATLFSFLNSCSRTSRANLCSVSGLDNNKFSIIFNKLIADKFIRINSDYVYPTDKFRYAYGHIDKSLQLDAGTMVS